MGIGEKIATLRKAKGMTQSDLGAELSVTYQAVSKWERGESLPDFTTISKLAKLFGVPLEHFDDEYNAEADDKEAGVNEVAEEEQSAAMIGVCTVCGKVVYEGDEERTSPAVVCKECAERERRQALARQAEWRAKKEKEAKQARREAESQRYAIIKNRNIGLISGGAAAGFWLLVFIVSLIRGQFSDSVAELALGSVVLMIFSFAFVAQLVWGGVVRNVTLTGGKLIGTPGVIFTLDLDGLIFLVAAKIFFAVIKFIVYILTTLMFAVAGFVMSPFVFVPRLLDLNRRANSLAKKL